VWANHSTKTEYHCTNDKNVIFYSFRAQPLRLHGKWLHHDPSPIRRMSLIRSSIVAEDRRLFHHPCFATRLGGVSGGNETQGWRDSSHTAMVGAAKFGSAKLPMATATYPGKPSLSQ
jgi:hypothetical protein